MAELKPIIEQSMKQYAGAVLQSRALIDVRDGLKPSARQIFYCMYTDKFLPKKPFKSTLKAIGSMARVYIHGDTSGEGVMMRAAQPFAMRYPLTEIEGNVGNLIASGNWAAPRYTGIRLSEATEHMFEDIDKDTILEWRDNYDNTEQYPSVLPSKGFYNIVNGTMGIGIGMACSVPQFNLKELNNALIYLIDHPDCDFNDIYCAPDFATGAILFNEKEVKDSIKNGNGFACKLRSVVEFDQKERCFIVTEIPYSVYTNTICKELETIIEGEENPGIERFNDLTGKAPLIKIYLSKKANPDKVLKYLYKNTSLQSYFSINFTMLDQGRFPKVFTWKEMLQAHIDHEKEVYRRGFEFDLRKIEKRIHIIDGLLICMASIEEVVQTIKSSTSTAAASTALQSKFLLDEEQAKAVLDMKLSRLAHLEVQKLEKEREDLLAEDARIKTILGNEELFNNELKNGWTEVAAKFGDARRTKIINLETTEGNDPIEVKALQLSLTNRNNVLATEVSTLYTQKRGTVGNKIKLENGEYFIASISVKSNEEILLFTQSGNCYHCPGTAFPIGEKTSLFNIIPIKEGEITCAMTSLLKKEAEPYIYFITRNGIIKKSEVSEYNINRKVGLRALNLDEGDEIINVIFSNKEDIGILTQRGNFVIIHTHDITPLGRVARGVKAIKLNDGDYVQSARAIPADTTYIMSISGSGLMKQTPFKEFSPQTRGTKGSKLQKLTDTDWMADFYPITTETELLIASTRSCLKLNITDIPIYSTGAQGVKSIKLGTIDNVVKVSCY